MTLCDYSFFPSSWETVSSDGIDERLSLPSLISSGCEELVASPLEHGSANRTTSTTATACNSNNNNSMTNEQPSYASLAVPTSVSLMAPPVTQDPNFVNVYMVVDPTKQTVTFPQQIVTYKTGDNVLSMAVVGPFSIADQKIHDLFQVAQAMTTTNAPCNSNNAAMLSNRPSSSSCLPVTAPPSSAISHPLPPVTFSANAIKITLESLNNLNKKTTAAALPPLKPLSAYNFFFRDERDRILNNNDSCEHDWSMIQQQRLLHDHWSRDRHAKRRHRKTHGKIDFLTLSRLISTRWKKLAEHRKDFYRQVASMDYARYQREQQQHETNQQQHLTNSSSTFINDYVALVA